MNTFFNKKKSSTNKVEEIFSLVNLSDPKEKEKFDEIAFQLDLMHEVKNLMDTNGWNQNYLATKLGKSKSYISQLFAGDKLLNIKTIIKLQNIFQVKFSLNIASKKVESPIESPFEIEFVEILAELDQIISSSQWSKIKVNSNKQSPVHSETYFVSQEGTLINNNNTTLEPDTYAAT